MTFEEFIERNGARLQRESAFELKFARLVFPHVDDLDFARVAIQKPFQDSMGKNRRIDFVIEEGASVRIAIEVDGWDKSGRGTGMSKPEFEDYNRREADMSGAGWTVLRFANTLFMREPLNCARNITLVLRRERSKAAAAGAVSLPAGTGEELSALERAELADLESRREAALRLLEVELTKVKAEASSMQKVVIAAAVIVVVVAGMAMLLVSRPVAQSAFPDSFSTWPGIPASVPPAASLEDSVSVTVPPLVIEEPEPSPPVAAPQTLLSSPVVGAAEAVAEPAGVEFCEGAINWQEARGREGDVVRIRGPVVGARYLEAVNGSPTFLDIGRAFPSTNQVSVVIWGRNRARFEPPPEVWFLGKEICLVGEVRITDRRPSMELVDPSDVLETR
jgi:very-short-patch-repair endonuclease